VRITLPEEAARTLSHAEVNGKRIPLKRQPNGEIELSGTGHASKPMRWTLVK
jgi:hypothetical protein